MRNLIALAALLYVAAPAPAADALDVYVIDVEGGKSVLIVSPSGESLVYDIGSPGREGRDVNRVVEALQAAGIKQIDYLVISHYDGDHMGDVPLLASKFPIRRIIDNGSPKTSNKGIPQRYETYAVVRDKLNPLVVHPGDKVPIRGIDVTVVAAGTKFLKGPLPGGGRPNPVCASTSQEAEIPEDLEDNMSIGLLFTFGRFRMLDLADLEAHYQYQLMCPNNPIGPVDVYHVSVHGQDKGISPVLDHAVGARVALMGNGPLKGGSLKALRTLKSAPGLEDIWMSHFSAANTKEDNPPENFIANLEVECQWKTIRLSAHQDGSFTVTNGRNGFSKSYPPRR
ncbi:MAG: MBL fold metallo-hydrolase [Acidobacteriota bacterium]